MEVKLTKTDKIVKYMLFGIAIGAMAIFLIAPFFVTDIESSVGLLLCAIFCWLLLGLLIVLYED